MSGHYSAGQFNDSFGARRLRNWQYGVQHPGKNCARRNCPTKCIADDRGHLLPHIPRNPSSSPWGNYRGFIWEESGGKCDCVDRIRNPQDYDRPTCNVLVAHETPNHGRHAKRTASEIAKMLFQPPPPPVVDARLIDPEDPNKTKENKQNTQSQEGGCKPCSKTSSTESLINRMKEANRANMCDPDQFEHVVNKSSAPKCAKPQVQCSGESEQPKCQYEQVGPQFQIQINPMAIPNGLNIDIDGSQTKPGTGLMFNVETGLASTGQLSNTNNQNQS